MSVGELESAFKKLEQTDDYDVQSLMNDLSAYGFMQKYKHFH